MKGSLIVVGFFALGLLAGRSGCMPTWLMEGDISMVALCALLLFVGIGIGLNPDMKSELKSLSPRLALLPLVTILGSWMGAAVAYLFLGGGICTFLQHRELTDCLAINSGFAIIHYQASSSPNTEVQNWAPSLFWPTSFAKWPHSCSPRYWLVGSARWLLSHRAARRAWTPPCPALPSPSDNDMRPCVSTTVS